MAAGKWPFGYRRTPTGISSNGSAAAYALKRASGDAGSKPFTNTFFGIGTGGSVSPAPVAATSSIPQPSGWFVTVTTDVVLLDDDDDNTYTSATFSKTQTWHYVGTTTNTSTGIWSGYRFLIPTAVAVADITNVALKLFTFDGTGSSDSCNQGRARTGVGARRIRVAAS